MKTKILKGISALDGILAKWQKSLERKSAAQKLREARKRGARTFLRGDTIRKDGTRVPNAHRRDTNAARRRRGEAEHRSSNSSSSYGGDNNSRSSSSGATAADILGVPPNATKAQIKAAWRKYAQRTHPDRGGDGTEFKRGKAAYNDLYGAAAAGLLFSAIPSKRARASTRRNSRSTKPRRTVTRRRTVRTAAAKRPTRVKRKTSRSR